MNLILNKQIALPNQLPTVASQVQRLTPLTAASIKVVYEHYKANNHRTPNFKDRFISNMCDYIMDGQNNIVSGQVRTEIFRLFDGNGQKITRGRLFEKSVVQRLAELDQIYNIRLSQSLPSINLPQAPTELLWAYAKQVKPAPLGAEMHPIIQGTHPIIQEIHRRVSDDHQLGIQFANILLDSYPRYPKTPQFNKNISALIESFPPTPYAIFDKRTYICLGIYPLNGDPEYYITSKVWGPEILDSFHDGRFIIEAKFHKLAIQQATLLRDGHAIQPLPQFAYECTEVWKLFFQGVKQGTVSLDSPFIQAIGPSTKVSSEAWMMLFKELERGTLSVDSPVWSCICNLESAHQQALAKQVRDGNFSPPLRSVIGDWNRRPVERRASILRFLTLRLHMFTDPIAQRHIAIAMRDSKYGKEYATLDMRDSQARTEDPTPRLNDKTEFCIDIDTITAFSNNLAIFTDPEAQRIVATAILNGQIKFIARVTYGSSPMRRFMTPLPLAQNITAFKDAQAQRIIAKAIQCGRFGISSETLRELAKNITVFTDAQAQKMIAQAIRYSRFNGKDTVNRDAETYRELAKNLTVFTDADAQRTILEAIREGVFCVKNTWTTGKFTTDESLCKPEGDVVAAIREHATRDRIDRYVFYELDRHSTWLTTVQHAVKIQEAKERDEQLREEIEQARYSVPNVRSELKLRAIDSIPDNWQQRLVDINIRRKLKLWANDPIPDNWQQRLVDIEAKEAKERELNSRRYNTSNSTSYQSRSPYEPSYEEMARTRELERERDKRAAEAWAIEMESLRRVERERENVSRIIMESQQREQAERDRQTMLYRNDPCGYQGHSGI